MIKGNALREALPFGKPSKSFDIFGFLKRYGIYILVFGSFFFAITTPVVFVIKQPFYEVHAFMKIDPVIATLITQKAETSITNYYDQYANTQSHSMKTYEVLKQTVEQLAPHEKASIFPAGLPSEKCAEILERVIVIKPLQGTHLIEIIASGNKREGLAPLVNKLMTVYLNRLQNSNSESDQDQLNSLRAKKEFVLNQMNDYEKSLDELTKDISTASYSESFNMASKNTEELQKLYDNVLTDRLKAMNNYWAIEQANNESQALSLDPIIDEIVMNDQSLHFTSSWTYQQLQEMRSTTDGLTPNNPDRIYVEQRMNAMQNYEKKQRKEVRNTANAIILGKRKLEMRKAIIQAKYDFEKSKKTEDDLQKELEKSIQESQRVSMGIHKGEYISASWKHSKDMLDMLERRIAEIEIEKKAPLRISIESHAREPKFPVSSNTNKLLMMLLAAAFCIVCGPFIAYEFFDNTIRRPEDIKQALGYLPTQTIVKTPKKKSYPQELSLGTDNFQVHAIGTLAVRFCHEKEKDNNRIILFTGIEKGVGSSSISFSCAKALAKMAPKILWIDGDIEAADIDQSEDYFPNLPGLRDFLSNTDSWKQYIVSTPDDNIDIMYAGNAIKGIIPLHRIRELLYEIKKEYDFVCIDALPVLQSNLTEQLAIYSDIITLISLGESTKYNALRRAAELLIRLEVPAIAPVLNFGGNKQTPSLDELFENPPEFIHRIIPKKFKAFINNSPPILEVIENMTKPFRRFRKSKQ
jgi:polysaccharide biosynthesis transport protein